MGSHFVASVGRSPAREHAGEATRQRADALFASRAASARVFDGGAAGEGGFGERGSGARVREFGVPDVIAERGRGSRDQDPDPPPRSPAEYARRPSWREAVFERLPVWLQLRCGMELRTVAAMAGVLVLAAAFAVHHFWAGRPRTVQVPPAVRGTAMAPAAHAFVPSSVSGDTASGPPSGPSPGGGVVVDVTGKVRRPGVLRLPAGSRVTDALKAAGGALPGTNTDALNLARPLIDGEQVVVGVRAGPPGGIAAPAGAGAGAGGVGGPMAGVGASGPVSLNTATSDQLDALPGVGPVLARHIIEYRTQHGGFTSVSQLRQVTGVGDRRMKDLQPLVRP